MYIPLNEWQISLIKARESDIFSSMECDCVAIFWSGEAESGSLLYSGQWSRGCILTGGVGLLKNYQELRFKCFLYRLRSPDKKTILHFESSTGMD